MPHRLSNNLLVREGEGSAPLLLCESYFVAAFHSME